MMNLKGKNIIITGASLGIGKETAKQLRAKGANVLITGRSETRLKAALREMDVKSLAFDIGDLDKVEANAQRCLALLDNKVDALINNAGIGISRPIEKLTQDDFLSVFKVNVFGLSLFTKAIIPQMQMQKKGSIVNIGSSASLKGYKNGSIYASSKFAVRCLTQCWQAELRPYNIRVSQINPSEVTTAFGRQERIERKEVHNKLRPKEIAHAIIAALEIDDRGFINELNVWATNPFD